MTDEMSGGAVSKTVGKKMLPANKSDQQLVSEDYLQTNTATSSDENIPRAGGDGVANIREPENSITFKQWVTVLILFYVNLINYMDRFTIAGECTRFKKSYIENSCEL